jgi:hypothetical protein
MQCNSIDIKKAVVFKHFCDTALGNAVKKKKNGYWHFEYPCRRLTTTTSDRYYWNISYGRSVKSCAEFIIRSGEKISISKLVQHPGVYLPASAILIVILIRQQIHNFTLLCAWHLSPFCLYADFQLK